MRGSDYQGRIVVFWLFFFGVAILAGGLGASGAVAVGAALATSLAAALIAGALLRRFRPDAPPAEDPTAASGPPERVRGARRPGHGPSEPTASRSRPPRARSPRRPG